MDSTLSIASNHLSKIFSVITSEQNAPRECMKLEDCNTKETSFDHSKLYLMFLMDNDMIYESENFCAPPSSSDHDTLRRAGLCSGGLRVSFPSSNNINYLPAEVPSCDEQPES